MSDISKYQYKITIFTPTYNRSYIIDKLYKSLKQQTIKSFEWLVVDDGSTDNTISLLKHWSKEEKEFPIRYVKTFNGGKHRAINLGTELAKGELFFIVDSDDYLNDKSIEIIINWYDSIESKGNEFIGVAGLKGYSSKEIVGHTFKGEYKDATALERAKFKIKGDKAEVFKTDILRKYKFPEIEGERFITEDLLWNRIAKDGYKIRWFNEIVYICDYLEDGLTNNINTIYLENFSGYNQYVSEFISYKEIKKYHRLKMLTAYTYRARLKGMKSSQISMKLKTNNFNVYIFILIAKIYKILKRD